MAKDCDLLSRNLTEEEVWSSFDWVVGCLSRHGVTTVSVMFGYDWSQWQFTKELTTYVVEKIGLHEQ